MISALVGHVHTKQNTGIGWSLSKLVLILSKLQGNKLYLLEVSGMRFS
jgi:hypothetical protein